MTPALTKHVYTTESYTGSPCADIAFVQEFSDSLYHATIGKGAGIHYMFLGRDPCDVETPATDCDISYDFDAGNWLHGQPMDDKVTLHY